MDVQELSRILRIGLGRAVLYLRDHDAAPYREAILHACLHNTVYDAQVENSRDQYLFEVIGLTGEVDFYRERILATLDDLTDSRDLEQVLGLLRLFAAQGDEEARRRLYEAFATNVGTGMPDGADDLVELDGLTALLLVADRLTFKEDERWYACTLVDLAAARDGEEMVARSLAEAAIGSPRIAALVKMVREEREHAQRNRARRWAREPAVGYDRIRQLMQEGDPSAGRLLTAWARQATDEELVRAATDLLDLIGEEPLGRLRAYLRLFRNRCFPLDPGPLLALARAPDLMTANHAIGALANVEHPEVRALAFELLAAGHGKGADLLVGNYQEGDYAVLERALRSWQDPFEVHSLGLALRHVVEAHPSPGAAGPLLALYEYGPCSRCRHRSVALLQMLGALPDWMIAECRHDANLDLRAAVGQPGR